MTQYDGVTKVIGEHTYKVMMLDPFTASDLLVDLTEIFGPALGALGASVLKAKDSKAALKQLMDGGGDPEDMKEMGDNLERALVGLIDRISKAKQRQIMSTMARTTSVLKGDKWPGLEGIFVVHFQGKLKEMYLWLAFAIRTQFADFFSA